jgi:hypothetical protein
MEITIDTAGHDDEGKGMAIQRSLERLKIKIVRLYRGRNVTEQSASLIEGERR